MTPMNLLLMILCTIAMIGCSSDDADRHRPRLKVTNQAETLLSVHDVFDDVHWLRQPDFMVAFCCYAVSIEHLKKLDGLNADEIIEMKNRSEFRAVLPMLIWVFRLRLIKNNDLKTFLKRRVQYAFENDTYQSKQVTEKFKTKTVDVEKKPAS